MILLVIASLALVLFIAVIPDEPIVSWWAARVAALVVAGWCTFFSAFWVFEVVSGAMRIGDAPLLFVFYALFAVVAWHVVWKASDPEYRPVLWSGFRWAVLLGVPAFLAGYLGPILLSWGGPLGPLLGILTGPLAALLGAAFGTWRALPEYRRHSRSRGQLP